MFQNPRLQIFVEVVHLFRSEAGSFKRGAVKFQLRAQIVMLGLMIAIKRIIVPHLERLLRLEMVEGVMVQKIETFTDLLDIITAFITDEKSIDRLDQLPVLTVKQLDPQFELWLPRKNDHKSAPFVTIVDEWGRFVNGNLHKDL